MASIGLAKGYNAYLVSKVQHALGERVLDVGCGAGNTTAYVRSRFVMGLDSSEYYLEQFRARLPGMETCRGDILDPDTVQYLKGQRFDTVFSSNVIEHIEDDRAAVRNIREVLTEGGRMALIVPNYQWLYGVHDEDVGHYRRYSPDRLRALSERSGFLVEEQFCINMPGIVWWFLNSSLRKKPKMEAEDAALVDRLIPVVKLLDTAFLGKVGLSIVQVARKL